MKSNELTYRIALGALLLGLLAAAPSSAPPEEAPPATPREFYNAGTRILQNLKGLPESKLKDALREAEAFFESAVAAQIERLQPPALYNLGHVRFRQGIEELKKGPSADSAYNRGEAIGKFGKQAITSADEALAGNDVQKMVAAYLRGHGVRRELKAALAAVRQALETYGTVLGKWQRASGDFHSTIELNQADGDARQNADVVDRSIAKLVDSLQRLQMLAQMLGQQNQELRQKLKQLRGRIPDKDMPPGAPGDEDDEEEQPNGPKEGQKEGPTKDGDEMRLSPEQAGWILEGFIPDNTRRLPMGQEHTAEPKDKSGKTW